MTSLGGKTLSACFAHIFKVFGEFPHSRPVFKICWSHEPLHLPFLPVVILPHFCTSSQEE